MTIVVEETKPVAMERSTDSELATNVDKDREDDILSSKEEGADILDVKCCRICLDEENDQGMIAPCRCKGTSKWVHRECLDQWRANNAQDLAFSRCMECRFNFQFEPHGNESHPRHLGRCLYWLLVSRDLIVATVVVQAFILLCAVIFWAATRNEEGIIEWVDDSYNPICRSSGCQFWACYAIGILVLFFFLGIYGSILLCLNKCSIHAAIHAGGRTQGRTTRGQPVVDGTVGNCPASCDCDCNCGGCGDEAAAVVLVLAIVVGAILVVIGFVLAAVVSVIIVQTILRRHLWILQKKTLTKEYRVRDLSCDPGSLSDSPKQTRGIETDRLVKLGLMEKIDRSNMPVPFASI